MHASPSPGTSQPLPPRDPTETPRYAMPCKITGCAGGYLFDKTTGHPRCDTCGDVRGA